MSFLRGKSWHSAMRTCADNVPLGTSKNLLRSTICAPAVLGLRRQEAEANSEAGPQGMPQERH
jgi:hypothetical protein